MPTPPVGLGRFRITKQTVTRPRRPRFDPRYELADAVFEDLRAVERADEQLQGFQVDRIQARKLLEDALSRNAFGTASIEGNPLSLEDVQSLLSRGPTPDAMARPEEREIFNYVAFMDTLPKRAARDCPENRKIELGIRVLSCWGCAAWTGRTTTSGESTRWNTS